MSTMSTTSKRVPLAMANQQPEPPPAPAVPPPAEGQSLEDQVVAVLKTCYDPEIPINIHELGLIYAVLVSPENKVHVKMTLTTPACPAAGSLPGEVERKVKAIPGVADAKVEVVWDPIWHQDMMSEAARLQLGLF
jgi:FeS assembly SUF system protein